MAMLCVPDQSEQWVSYETIYVQGRGALRRELAACLRARSSSPRAATVQISETAG
jgi:hypothetical protein